MGKFICFVVGMLLMWNLQLNAQSTQVKGKVKDSKDGLPLSGVSVRLKGSDAGVQTDMDGNFTITVSGKQPVLIFTYIGYAKEEVPVGTRNNLTIALTTEERKLQEVVVVAYGTQDKTKLTGSVSKVDGKELQDIPMTSVDQVLQGKVAGLQSVAATGQPGGLQQIRIRGIGSIYASSEPLYVVDGVPINSGDFSRNSTTSNALAGINADDIESVSVLKDAAAASLYGSRAANGVILITTRKGHAGKTRVGFDAEYGWSNVAFLNDNAKPLNASEYKALTHEGLINAGYTDSGATAFLNNVLQANNGYNTNWLDEVTRQGISQQYNLSVSGGDPKTTFYLSGGYFKQQSVVIGSDFTRYTGSVSLNHHVGEKISLGLKLSVAHYDQNTPNQSANFRSPVLAGFYLRPFQHPFNKDGSYDYSPADFEQIYNPLAIVHYDKQLLSNSKLLGSVFGEYNILKNLKFSSRLGIDYFNLEELLYYNPFFGDAVTRGGDLNNYYTRVFNWVWTNTLDFHQNVLKSGDLSFDFKLGYESQKSKEYDITAYGSGVPGVTSLLLPPTSTPKTANGGGSDYSFASAFSNLQFNYKNKLFLSGSLRRDGSSRFGSNNRYGTFWSVGGAWDLNRENFLDNQSLISTLKLRASYGVNGNAGGGNVTSSTGTTPTTPGFGNYTWRPLYGFGIDNNGFSTNYNQQPGGAPFQVGNENLTWEQNKPFDVGLELGIIQNRVVAEFDYYDRKTSRLLQNAPLSLTSGFGAYPANVGSMENKGIELTVNATPILTKDFRWDLSFNIAMNRNKVLALDKGQDIIVAPQIIRVGKDIQSVYTFIWAGVDPQTGSGLWYTDGTKKATTSDITKVSNAIIGSNSPKGFGGFTTSFSYKGISLNAQFYYQYGNLVYDQWGFLNQSDGAFYSLNQNRNELRRWQKPGDKTDMPQYVVFNQSQSNATSSRYFYKGDYIRLRNLTLAYQFPKNILKTVKSDNIQVYIRGTNLWTKAFDKNLTFDPEQPINGTNDLQILMQKTFSIGLNLNF